MKVRVLSTGGGRKTDPDDAHAVALCALHHKGLHAVHRKDQTTILRLLSERRPPVEPRSDCPPTKRRQHSGRSSQQGPPRPVPRDLTKELLADLRRIDAKIKTNEGQMRDALAATTTTLPQVHGIGIVLAAKLLGAMSSPVEVGAEDLGADPLCVLDPVALTHIDGRHLPAAMVVAHCHPHPAPVRR